MALRVPADIQARLLDVLALDTEDLMVLRSISDARARLVALDDDVEYQRLVREAEDLADRHDDLAQTCAHLESDIATAKARIAHDRERERTTSDAKEVASLEHEIASLERRIEMLEDQELATMEERDRVAGTWSAVKIARDSFHDARAEQRAALESDIAAAMRRREDIATGRADITSDLPQELIDLYEKQRERYGVGASHLRAGITSASGVTLTAGQIHEVRAADPDEVLLCPDSNAILIRTAESGL